jgi:hypothetical protein
MKSLGAVLSRFSWFLIRILDEARPSYIDVLDSQRSLFNAELTLAQTRNNEYESLAQLFKALADG